MHLKIANLEIELRVPTPPPKDLALSIYILAAKKSFICWQHSKVDPMIAIHKRIDKYGTTKYARATNSG